MKKSIVCIILLLAVIGPMRASAQADNTTVWFSDDGRFMAELPENWSAAVQSSQGNQGSDELVQLQIANQPGMAETAGPAFESGAELLAVVPYPQNDYFEDDGTLDAAFATFIEDEMLHYVEAMGATTTSQVSIEADTASISASIPQFDLMIQAVKYLAPDTFGIFTFAAPTGELTPNALAELAAVAATVRYSPILTETYQTDEATFQFAYPADWDIASADFDSLPVVTLGHEIQTDNDPLRWAMVMAAFPPEATSVLDFSTPEAMTEHLTNIGTGIANILIWTGIANTFSEEPVFADSEFLTLPFAETITVAHLPFTSESVAGGVVLFYDGTQAWVTAYASLRENGATGMLMALNIGLSLDYQP